MLACEMILILYSVILIYINKINLKDEHNTNYFLSCEIYLFSNLIFFIFGFQFLVVTKSLFYENCIKLYNQFFV